MLSFVIEETQWFSRLLRFSILEYFVKSSCKQHFILLLYQFPQSKVFRLGIHPITFYLDAGTATYWFFHVGHTLEIHKFFTNTGFYKLGNRWSELKHVERLLFRIQNIGFFGYQGTSATYTQICRTVKHRETWGWRLTFYFIPIYYCKR